MFFRDREQGSLSLGVCVWGGMREMLQPDSLQHHNATASGGAAGAYAVAATHTITLHCVELPPLPLLCILPPLDPLSSLLPSACTEQSRSMLMMVGILLQRSFLFLSVSCIFPAMLFFVELKL